MPHEPLDAFLDRLHRTLLGKSLDLELFATGILTDLGVDGMDLRPDTIHSLLSDSSDVDWERVSFAFAEGIAVYDAGGLDSLDEFVRFAFMATTVAIAIYRGHGDWEFVFDSVLRILIACSDLVSVDIRIKVLERTLSMGNSLGVI